ncbi:hypothetical protein BASA50_004409 [Batrachochytrium salamandrivorans]|uniref:Kynurenine formamidase n=1 Tax=Batrachochytrium salamandrivorans TaxID=1357716 RepID=A0ABQ8FFP4_9FUNG|nr:hypothetical protein BASA50_004409 [Batrachochytrium salamandrivorans]
MSGETKGLELSAACSLGQVRRVKDNHYYAGTPHANRALDLYLPGVKQADTDMSSTTTTTTTGDSNAAVAGTALQATLSSRHPVVVYVHGGAWITGDRADYDFIGEALAQRGIVTAIAGYRLSPKQGSIDPACFHPMHLQDIIDAVAWVGSPASSSLLGYTPESVVLVGHSAGAQLSAMLSLMQSASSSASASASNSDSLQVVLPTIAGVVGIEGIYSLPDLARTHPAYVPWFIERAFSTDPSVWHAASPTEVATAQLLASSAITTTAATHATSNNSSSNGSSNDHSSSSSSALASNNTISSHHHLPRYLLIHSPEDELVACEQTDRYASVLHRLGVSVEVCNDILGTHDAVLSNSLLHDKIAAFVKS